ncbi:enolase-phosphatase E1-like isoform X2 [Acropora palmata]|uniref:enolase-phosphatase E1-like isoform X2 n=1 Tax=Acropora palmata TaxID=6131 RepID=UPI003DA1213E
MYNSAILHETERRSNSVSPGTTPGTTQTMWKAIPRPLQMINMPAKQPREEMATPEGEVSELDYEVVLLDIEGTTTPITFVKDVLFPLAKNNVRRFLERNWDSAQCQEDVLALKIQAENDKDVDGVVSILDSDNDQFKDMNGQKESKDIIIESVVKNVIWQMNSDRKTTALKQLQGHIWREAYENEEIKGDLFEDVLPAFKYWTSNNIKIFIYSSGSIDAQRLLFGNSTFGDLLKYISGHFDTKVGAKTEPKSYKAISDIIHTKPSRILFVTDVTKEKINLSARADIFMINNYYSLEEGFQIDVTAILMLKCMEST